MNKNTPILTIFIRFGISLGITLIAGAIIVLISTAVAYIMEDPTGMIKTVSVISMVLTALTGGIAASRICGKESLHPILFSAITGVLYVMLTVLLTVLPVKAEEDILNIPKILIYLVIISLFTLGGIIGFPRDKRKHPYKKKSRR